MGKSINIVSVTKVTIDNVVSEFTKKVKEYQILSENKYKYSF